MIFFADFENFIFHKIPAATAVTRISSRKAGSLDVKIPADPETFFSKKKKKLFKDNLEFGAKSFQSILISKNLFVLFFFPHGALATFFMFFGLDYLFSYNVYVFEHICNSKYSQ